MLGALKRNLVRFLNFFAKTVTKSKSVKIFVKNINGNKLGNTDVDHITSPLCTEFIQSSGFMTINPMTVSIAMAKKTLKIFCLEIFFIHTFFEQLIK